MTLKELYDTCTLNGAVLEIATVRHSAIAYKIKHRNGDIEYFIEEV